MLVLSRKIGERLVIGDQIVIQILEVCGRQVRLGIKAPAAVGIWREELAVCLEPAHQESIPKPYHKKD